MLTILSRFGNHEDFLSDKKKNTNAFWRESPIFHSELSGLTVLDQWR